MFVRNAVGESRLIGIAARTGAVRRSVAPKSRRVKRSPRTKVVRLEDSSGTVGTFMSRVTVANYD
jgi:hypothetical protein